MLIISLTIIASLFYVLATSHVLSRLFHQQGPSQKVTVILSTVAIVAHMLLLVNSVFRSDGQDLIIATLYGVQFYFIDKRLKRKDLAIVHSHLPPLMVVERQLYQLLNLGTILLTFALLSGFVFLDGMFAKEFIHKTILSLVAWAIFAIVAIGHMKKGWRGKPVVITIMVAAFVLTLAYFGSRFIQEVILNKF